MKRAKIRVDILDIPFLLPRRLSALTAPHPPTGAFGGVSKHFRQCRGLLYQLETMGGADLPVANEW